MWNDDDFRLIFTVLGNFKELLKTPEAFKEYAELLAQDCRDATDSLLRIADGCGATA